MLPGPPVHATLHGQGDPLLLVHGDFNSGAQAWKRQIADPGGRRLLVPDRPGYGASVPADPPFTIARDAAALLAAAAAAGWPRFDLAGHSYGGLVAIEMTRLAPDRVRSLLLVEPPYAQVLPDHPDIIALWRGIDPIWAAADSLTDDEIAEGFFAVVAGPEETGRLRANRSWPTLASQARRAVAAESPVAYPAEALADLPSGLPVAVLTGGRSNLGLQAIARELQRRIPDATLHVSPGAGHAVQFDAPLFADAVAALDRRARERERERPHQGA
ncbi:MAG: alpha/beta fold hydrolase [Chloroflexota bacterium]